MELLTNSEYEVVSLLWAEGRPLSKSEIIELSVNREWKKSSIHVILNSLLDKGIIKVDSFVSIGKTYARTFSPAITEEDYVAFMLNYQKRKKPVNLPSLFSALNETDSIDPSTIAELEELVHKMKQKSEAKGGE